MCQHLTSILNDREMAEALSRSGLETILARHTCGHRVDELIGILRTLGSSAEATGKETAEAAE